MSERALIQRPWQVRTLLDGRRTQVRVPVRGAPHGVSPCPHSSTGWAEIEGGGGCMCSREVRCPLGALGVVLAIRETFRHIGNVSTGHGPVQAQVAYRADGATLRVGAWGSHAAAPEQSWWNTGRTPWQSPAVMPLDFARIRLRVLDLRVHPVRDITEPDAAAEGVEPAAWEVDVPGRPAPLMSAPCHRAGFAGRWIEAHGRASWDDGYCFAATVERIDEEDR